ncbi:hypothetical protein MPTK1_6g06470 [Marchantia polymorpha subsp. ruderalis]|uniref:Uncharacterized protein n=2 Tax=Marchantia polymorpha TaxID=3197 RepID=A0AAF6BP65_MARPO|nr:hypothetical protein MARPO_0226s0008 [Marchantia polymorpha]BBN13799.1 hypothetical protein Mp_6g06470 [Marchantia polymorpha subsp. ruderalis]|eukprot:PTQ27079.1 hypothetical protein MARPO_0226s0008 [Marchantia polymorpha]
MARAVCLRWGRTVAPGLIRAARPASTLRRKRVVVIVTSGGASKGARDSKEIIALGTSFHGRSLTPRE